MNQYAYTIGRMRVYAERCRANLRAYGSLDWAKARGWYAYEQAAFTGCGRELKDAAMQIRWMRQAASR
jgi:hypothetical protein